MTCHLLRSEVPGNQILISGSWATGQLGGLCFAAPAARPGGGHGAAAETGLRAASGPNFALSASRRAPPTWPGLPWSPLKQGERPQSLSLQRRTEMLAARRAPGSNLPGHLPDLISPNTPSIFLRGPFLSQFLMFLHSIPSPGLPRFPPTTFWWTKFVGNVALCTSSQNGQNDRSGLRRSLTCIPSHRERVRSRLPGPRPE